ncbi:MAG: peptidase M23 [Eubacteriales Family XIII. Incertae Sedis bacterium]|nr:MAG: peptidase M23 [Clostridiales Family XIII bacterium]
MRKRITAFITALVMLFSMSSLFAYADNESDAQAALDEIRGEQSALNSELQKGKAVENDLNKEIKALEANIATLNLEISELGASINLTQEKINNAELQLNQVEADIAEQQKALGDRLAAMYMNGNVGFVEVVLGSSSISDLMTNLDRVQMVYEQDKEMLEELEVQQKVIQAQREYLDGLRADLQAAKDTEAEKKELLDADKATVADKKAAVAQDNKALEEQLDALNAEANALIAEILKLQGDGDFIGGDFTWPAPGISRTTSEFGNRLHPIFKTYKLHTGLDIGAPTNTTIVASNAGTVIKAGWNNSYGYMVMIDHGGGIVTLYAHNSSLLVKQGDVVYKGQAISKSGSTGNSTGPHLHFEVRVNGQYVDPRNYVTYGK